MKKNYPNLFRGETVLHILLHKKSSVTVELFDENETKITTILEKQELIEGRHEIKFNGNQLKPGVFKAKITIESPEKTLTEYCKVQIN